MVGLYWKVVSFCSLVLLVWVPPVCDSRDQCLSLTFVSRGSPVVVPWMVVLIVNSWVLVYGCVVVGGSFCVPLLVCGRGLSEVKGDVCVLGC